MSDTIRACLYMALAMAGFTIGDTIIKSMNNEINSGQVMLVRGLMMIVVLGLYMRIARTPATFKHVISKPMVLRVLAEAFATVSFLIGLSYMPIGNVSAIMQALPLVVTLGAWAYLGEPLGWRRLTAILVGFAGVLIVIQPGSTGFNGYAILILFTVFLATIRDLATRKLASDVPNLLVSLLTSVTVTAFGAIILFPLGGWQPMSAMIWVKLVSAAVFLFIGYQYITMAMRIGEVAIVAPFRYTALLWAIGLGYVFFGDIPDRPTLIGSALIVASGLYALYRENLKKRSVRPAASTLPPPARGT